MINNLIKSFIRMLLRIKYQRINVVIAKHVLFNINTIFGGWNKIHESTCVSGSYIGKYSFIGKNCYLPNVRIGNFCSIGNNIHVVAETHPSSGFLSTHPIFYSTNKQCGKSFVEKDLFDERLKIDGRSCIIGNDVWIGNDVRILGGLSIGDGAIIALGAIVTKDVPPYSVVGGVPAKVIRYRFNQDKIKYLLNLKWWDKDEKWIKSNINLFQHLS